MLTRTAPLTGILALALAGCPSGVTPGDAAAPDVPASTPDAQPDAVTDAPTPPPTDVPVPTGPAFCTLGQDVPGLVVPAGFCARSFARVGAPRVLAFAPNGDLFVAAPSAGTPGGAPPGPGAIVVVSDDNHDGVGELHTYANELPDVHGLAFGAGGALFFTTSDSVYRYAYTPGDRRAVGRPTAVAQFQPGAIFSRWTHGLAYSADGTLYATQGNHGSSTCPPTEMDGAITRVGDRTMSTIAYGFRNPMYIRCHHTANVCLAAELSDDSDSYGAPEKIVVVRPGSNYAYPCCVTMGVDSINNPGGSRFNCSAALTAASTIPLHDTPFGLDWAPDSWPEPFRNALFVALHGSAYHAGFRGAGVQFAATSPLTQVPGETWANFIAYEGRGSALLRPTDITFAPDGRLFLSDDAGGQIFWIAPTTLRMPTQ